MNNPCFDHTYSLSTELPLLSWWPKSEKLRKFTKLIILLYQAITIYRRFKVKARPVQSTGMKGKTFLFICLLNLLSVSHSLKFLGSNFPLGFAVKLVFKRKEEFAKRFNTQVGLNVTRSLPFEWFKWSFSDSTKFKVSFLENVISMKLKLVFTFPEFYSPKPCWQIHRIRFTKYFEEIVASES